MLDFSSSPTWPGVSASRHGEKKCDDVKNGAPVVTERKKDADRDYESLKSLLSYKPMPSLADQFRLHPRRKIKTNPKAFFMVDA